jgi:AcrR family transcriptional regulator
MNRIAEEAGVTKATLYQRYADKQALLRAVLLDRIDAWSTDPPRDPLLRGETLANRLRYYAISILERSRNPEVRAFELLIRNCWGTAPETAEEMSLLRTAKILQVLEADLIELSALEGMAVIEPGQMARLFLAMLKAYAPENSDSEIAREAFADLVVGTLLLGRAAWLRFAP